MTEPQVTLDPKTGNYVDAGGRRYSLAGSGSGEVLIPLDTDPAWLRTIDENIRRAAEARARIAPQIMNLRSRISELNKELTDAGCLPDR